jgi:hypothetical protein
MSTARKDGSALTLDTKLKVDRYGETTIGGLLAGHYMSVAEGTDTSPSGQRAAVEFKRIMDGPNKISEADVSRIIRVIEDGRVGYLRPAPIVIPVQVAPAPIVVPVQVAQERQSNTAYLSRRPMSCVDDPERRNMVRGFHLSSSGSVFRDLNIAAGDTVDSLGEHGRRIADNAASIPGRVQDWWVNAKEFFDASTGDKLLSEGGLRKANIREEGYYVLNIEDSQIMLRKYGGKYYAVGQSARGFGYSDESLYQQYDLKQTQRWLQWANTGLTTILHMLPFGQTFDLLAQGKTDEALKAAAYDAAFMAAGGLGQLAKSLKGAAVVEQSAAKLWAARGIHAAVAAWHGSQTLANVSEIVDKLKSGDYTIADIAGLGGQAVVHLFGAVGNFRRAIKCFPAGTPVLTPDGWRPIESIRPGDLVLSQPELDVNGPIEPRRVTHNFERHGGLLGIQVEGRVIRSTAEHPFYVAERGWVEAFNLQPGDRLWTHDGRYVVVDGVSDVEGEVPVYNIRVEEYHTYFIGGASWGFSLWVHNAGKAYLEKAAEEAFEKAAAKAAAKEAADAPVKPGQSGTYGDLKKQKKTHGESESLDMDHRPSYASQKKALEDQLGRKLTDAEAKALKNDTPAVATPRAEHQQNSRTYGGRNTPEQIAEDAKDLNKARRLDEEAMNKKP